MCMHRATRKYYQWCAVCCHARCGGKDHVGCTKGWCWFAPNRWKKHIASNVHARAISINFRTGQPAQDSYSKAWSNAAAALGLGSSHRDDDQPPLLHMSSARTMMSGRAGDAGVAGCACTDDECEERKAASCGKLLACGHACCCVRGEGGCLLCLEDECKACGASKEDFCSICYAERLGAAGRPSSALLSLEGAQENDSPNIMTQDVSGNLDFFPMRSTSDGQDDAVTELPELFYESGVETSSMTLTSTPGQGVHTTGMTLAGKAGPVPPERLWIIHPHLLTQEAEQSLRSEIIQVCKFVADLSLLELHIRFVHLPAVTGSPLDQQTNVMVMGINWFGMDDKTLDEPTLVEVCQPDSVSWAHCGPTVRFRWLRLDLKGEEAQGLAAGSGWDLAQMFSAAKEIAPVAADKVSAPGTEVENLFSSDDETPAETASLDESTDSDQQHQARKANPVQAGQVKESRSSVKVGVGTKRAAPATIPADKQLGGEGSWAGRRFTDSKRSCADTTMVRNMMMNFQTPPLQNLQWHGFASNLFQNSHADAVQAHLQDMSRARIMVSGRTRMASSAEVLSMDWRRNSTNPMMTHDSIGDWSPSNNPAASSHPAASSAWELPGELAELFYEIEASSPNVGAMPISRAATMATKTAITSLRIHAENHALKEKLASQQQLIKAQAKEIEGLMGLLSAGMHRRFT